MKHVQPSIQQLKNVLIVRTDRIGDVILTLPMAKVLKEQMPHVQVAMLIQQYTSELVEDVSSVDRILYYDDNNGPLPFFQLVQTLRLSKFDAVFHTHPRFRVALITWLAGIPIRVGTGYRWYSFLFSRKVFEHRKHAQFHELEYNLHLLQTVGCTFEHGYPIPILPLNSEASLRVNKLLTELGVQSTERLVILHPGSGRSARDWSAENFGRLGNLLRSQLDLRIIITGGKGENQLANIVQTLVGGNALTIVGQLSLREYAALAKSAALFIANSTGPIHIAAAVGTPVIGLYPHVAPMSPARWQPYTTKKNIFTPQGQPTNCRKCVKKLSSRCECMDTIPVDAVFRAASSMLEQYAVTEEQ